ncbi:MurR/RpiR family transcriptional regulator, partial [Pseudomonas aeruginosa]
MIQKDKVRVDIFGERFRTRASQLTPGLRVVASYINEHREVVLEQTAM